MSIERNLEISFIARLALREKQIQQSYRPVIAVHKWFARRPGTLFRGLILSEFVEEPLREAYYCPRRLKALEQQVADLYQTTCKRCGNSTSTRAFLRVRTRNCPLRGGGPHRWKGV